MKAYHGIVALICIALTNSLVDGQDQREQDVRDVANANNEFTTALYNVLKDQNPGGNLLFSPFSLSAAMAMVKAGASGVTADEIQKGMRYPASDKILYSGYSVILDSLKSNENFTLETANRIYSQTGFALNPTYLDVLRNSLKAEAKQLDFAKSAESAQAINGWVEQVTRNKIKNLVSADDFDALTRLVLVNAIYFKGQWDNKFDPEFTRQEQFYVSPTKNVTVDMMKKESDYPYVDLTAELDAKAVSLPYKGNRLSMIVILPNKPDGLAELEKRLQTYKISDIPPRMRTRKISLSMPKFKLETTIDLTDTLRKLGMKSMFGQDADFSKIPAPGTHEPLQLSKAVQKAFLEVNEEGSEAAAATAAIAMARSYFVPPVFQANSPFVHAIVSYEVKTSRTNKHASSRGRPRITNVNVLFNGRYTGSERQGKSGRGGGRKNRRSNSKKRSGRQ
jgi:serpin B